MFRRAQLGADVTVYKDWHFKTQYDFAENAVGFSDVYLRYTGFDGLKITAGQFKMPFSLEEMTSSNNITFMERSLPSIYAAARRIGVGIDVQQPLFTASAAVYGRNVGTTTIGDEPLAVGGRVTFTPFNSDGRVLHVGGAVAYEWTDDSDALRLRQRPESRVDGVRLVDTGGIANASAQFKYGLELAGGLGPFSLQGVPALNAEPGCHRSIQTVTTLWAVGSLPGNLASTAAERSAVFRRPEIWARSRSRHATARLI